MLSSWGQFPAGVFLCFVPLLAIVFFSSIGKEAFVERTEYVVDTMNIGMGSRQVVTVADQYNSGFAIVGSFSEYEKSEYVYRLLKTLARLKGWVGRYRIGFSEL